MNLLTHFNNYFKVIYPNRHLHSIAAPVDYRRYNVEFNFKLVKHSRMYSGIREEGEMYTTIFTELSKCRVSAKVMFLSMLKNE